MPVIALNGCAPIPLAHYLKALGILRLVAESEHGDANATSFATSVCRSVGERRISCKMLSGTSKVSVTPKN